MNNTVLRNMTLLTVLLCLTCAIAACGSGLQGTYSDASGNFVLELKSSSEASFSIITQIVSCSYKVKGEKLTLDCPGDVGKIVLTIHDDGSLTGPPEGFLPVLRRKSSARPMRSGMAIRQ